MDATSRSDTQTRILARTGSFGVGVVAGSGFIARAASAGGADFLLALNAGRLRNMGCASIACMMPMADADTLTLDFAEREILPATELPVLLGTSSWSNPPDATAIMDAGFAGAVNFPSCMHYGPAMRAALDRVGLGFAAEIERLAAVQRAGGVAMLYCGTREHVRAGAEAGIDHLLYNYGWNAGAALGDKGGHAARMSLHEAAQVAHDISRLVRRIRPKAQLLLEGGPIVTADDLGFVLRSASIDGYIGGSTIERLPLERSVADRISAYRLAQHQPGRADSEQERLLRWGARAGFPGRSDALIEFLKTLRAVADGRDGLWLGVEDGVEVEPTLDALRDAMGIGRHTSRSALIDGLVPPASVPTNAGMIVVRNFAALPRALRNELGQTGARLVRIERARATDESGWLSLTLPPLRDRLDDIEVLWNAAIDRVLGTYAKRRPLSSSALLRLRGHDWPGNERELADIARAVALGRPEDPIHGDEIETALSAGQSDSAPIEAAELNPKAQILQALWRNGYRKGRTASALGIGRKTLYNRMKRYGIST